MISHEFISHASVAKVWTIVLDLVLFPFGSYFIDTLESECTFLPIFIFHSLTWHLTISEAFFVLYHFAFLFVCVFLTLSAQVLLCLWVLSAQLSFPLQVIFFFFVCLSLKANLNFICCRNSRPVLIKS